jgi:putative transposase
MGSCDPEGARRVVLPVAAGAPPPGDKALWGVIMTAYTTGTSTRKVDDLVRALGCESGVSKSTVSRICADIDEEVAIFRSRRLDHVGFPYMYLDATYIKARINHRIISRAVVVATGVTGNGDREVLGVDVGDSEDEVFWTAFLRGLKDRGLTGVRLVISDAHAGLKASIPRVLAGAGWQRCKVHLMRNILGTVPAASKDMVAATVRTIFAQPSSEAWRCPAARGRADPRRPVPEGRHDPRHRRG